MKLLTNSILDQILKEVREAEIAEDPAPIEAAPAAVSSEQEKQESPPIGASQEILSRGLKVKHKQSGLRYTIHNLDDTNIVLKTPENRLFSVDRDELEKQYVLA